MLRRAPALRLRGLDAPAEQAIAVHLDSLEHSRVRSVGCERLALHALDQLGWQDALWAQGVSARDAAVAAALVVARMVHPSSEHAAHAWLAGSSATLELLGLERAKPLSLSKLYRTSDLLWKHREALETALAQRERSLFDTPEAIVFYDLTNVHYHGRPAGDTQFGRSKQKRSDCPLATLALALDGAGFPRCSEVLKGNVSEPGTLQAALERLEAQLATAIRIEPNGKHPARDAQAGMYVLRTSHTQWGPERVVQTYWQLAEIEAAFRSLKGEAGLRPIFHVKPSRIRAHLFLAVLAYHGVHLLRKRLAQAGLRSSWETIRRQPAGWVRLTTPCARPTAAGSSAARTPAQTPKPQNWPGPSA